MSTKAILAPVVITCSIKPDKMEVAKRKLRAVIKTVMLNDRGLPGHLGVGGSSQSTKSVNHCLLG
jgi:hypothetical protein